MRLSESFVTKNSEWIDLKAECYNINKSVDGEILRKSMLLNGYSILVDKINKYKKQGMIVKQAISKAVEECIAEGILVKFLNENKMEVNTMFDTEWNMKDALRVRGEECFEEGIAIGEAKGEARGEAKGRAEGALNTAIATVRNLMKNLKLSAQAAMDAAGISPADRPAILAAL